MGFRLFFIAIFLVIGVSYCSGCGENWKTWRSWHPRFHPTCGHRHHPHSFGGWGWPGHHQNFWPGPACRKTITEKESLSVSISSEIKESYNYPCDDHLGDSCHSFKGWHPKRHHKCDEHNDQHHTHQHPSHNHQWASHECGATIIEITPAPKCVEIKEDCHHPWDDHHDNSCHNLEEWHPKHHHECDEHNHQHPSHQSSPSHQHEHWPSHKCVETIIEKKPAPKYVEIEENYEYSCDDNHWH